MKKRLIAGVMIVGLIGASLAGCGSKELSNDYIKITQYKGLEVDKVEVTEVTDEDVENDIQNTLEAKKIYNEVTDRSVEDGDTVTINYVGKVDGEEFDGGSAEGAQLEIGSNSFIEGFEEAIIGHAAGETFDIDVTFPDNYNNSDLAGKAAVFTITLSKIETTSLPELNDEFIATVSEESATVEEYKKEVKKTLQESNDKTAESTLQQEVCTALLENIEATKYPEEELEEAKESLQSSQETTASYYGMELADYIAAMGMTEEQFDEKITESAQSNVKFMQAVELIAEKEKLTPTEEKYQEKYEELAESYGYESADALIEAATEATVQKSVLQTVVIEWLVENCKQVEPTVDKDTTNTTSGTEESSKDTTENTTEDSAEE